MKYEVIKIDKESSPVRKDENTFSQRIIVTTGIVDNIYEGFQNRNGVDVEYPAKGIDADAIEKYIETKAKDFVSETYPNTK